MKTSTKCEQSFTEKKKKKKKPSHIFQPIKKGIYK